MGNAFAPTFCVLFSRRVRKLAGMILWALALVIVICTAVAGYYQGAVRATLTLVGLLAASFLAGPAGILFKTLLPVLGVSSPLYLAYLCPVLGFIFVLTVFKVGALAAHKKIEHYYRHTANDTQRMLFERLNARVGVGVGVANGVGYTLALFTLLYSMGYFTVQVGTGDQDAWVMRTFNRVCADLEGTKVDKAIAAFMPKSELYYDASDVVADIFQTPLLQNRLANYPPLLMLGEREEFKLLSNDQFKREWINGMTFGAFMNHDSVRIAMESGTAYTNVLALLGGGAKDLKTYLETGKSPRFDDEKILGRWSFDSKASISLARKRKPTMSLVELKRLRAAMGALNNAMVIATVDHKTYLRVPSLSGDRGNTKGTWKTSGSSYSLGFSEGAQKTEIEAAIEGRNLIFTKDGFVLVFENTRV